MTILPTEIDTGSTIPAIASVRVRAAADQLSALRGLAGTIAHNHGFDVDDVADLELAVDEAAGMLIPHAIPGTDIACTFQAPAGALRIVISVTSPPSSPFASKSSFGWFVLEALTDSIELEIEAEPKVLVGDPVCDASNAAAVTLTLLKNLPQRDA